MDPWGSSWPWVDLLGADGHCLSCIFIQTKSVNWKRLSVDQDTFTGQNPINTYKESDFLSSLQSVFSPLQNMCVHVCPLLVFQLRTWDAIHGFRELVRNYKLGFTLGNQFSVVRHLLRPDINLWYTSWLCAHVWTSFFLMIFNWSFLQIKLLWPTFPSAEVRSLSQALPSAFIHQHAGSWKTLPSMLGASTLR